MLADNVYKDNHWRFIRDDQGRALVFHGLNFISQAKSTDGRIVPLEEADLSRMAKDWGMNAVRYLVFWDAIEPEPGQYDDEYLARVRLEFDQLHAYGFHVIVDFHQDVYSRVFCCDGAPPWAIRDDGIAFEQQDQWFLNYLEPAVQRTWDNFWAYDRGDHADLQDHYTAMIAYTAKRLGDHPAVMGYDLMNEPHPGSLFDAGETLGVKDDSETSREFDTEYYTPFLQRAIDAVRIEDQDGWLFFEPRYGGPGAGAKSHIQPLVDPRDGEQRLFYFPHMYSLVLEANEAYDPDKDVSIANWTKHRIEEANLLKTPMGLGEFGLAHHWEGADTFLDELLFVADQLMASWTYWSYDPGAWGMHGHDTESGESPLIDRFVRAYPRYIAGTPRHYAYDRETREFTLSYVADDAVGPTEIYIPAARYYPNGYQLTISDMTEKHYTQEWDASSEVLKLSFSKSAPPLREITIVPK